MYEGVVWMGLQEYERGSNHLMSKGRHRKGISLSSWSSGMILSEEERRHQSLHRHEGSTAYWRNCKKFVMVRVQVYMVKLGLKMRVKCVLRSHFNRKPFFICLALEFELFPHTKKIYRYSNNAISFSWYD